MPKIVIKEYDNTTAGAATYQNFTVLIPGFVANAQDQETPSIFDENGVVELTSQKEFITKIGKVGAANPTDSTKSGDGITHLGNQMAYELLGLGYKVLYKELSDTTELEDSDFWAPLVDKSIYDFRYVVTGLLEDTTGAAANNICNLASFRNTLGENETNGRGDCIALVDVARSAYDSATSQADIINGITSWVSKVTSADTFSAFFAPHVVYGNYSDSVYINNTFPASFHYLACAINAFDGLGFNEWFAVAGYTRGVTGSKEFSITSTGCKLGEAAVDALQPRTIDAKNDDHLVAAVNTIIKDRNGYYIWGNRTAHALDDKGLVASHFLNIRQLCTTLKKQIYFACRQVTFDPNSDTLWFNFVNLLTPLLDKMKAAQGIQDYKLIKVKTKVKGVLKVKVRIVPIEAVEDFDISVYLEDSVSGATVAVEEE